MRSAALKSTHDARASAPVALLDSTSHEHILPERGQKNERLQKSKENQPKQNNSVPKLTQVISKMLVCYL